MFRFKRAGKFAGLLLTAALLATTAIPAVSNAAGKSTQKKDYLALGDSLAAGQTPYKEIDKGYPDLLAERIDEIEYLGSFTDRYAVSGYTTADVLKDIEDDVFKHQDGDKDKLGIQNTIKNAELITLDAGANDLLHHVKINQDGSIELNPEEIPGVLKEVGSNLAQIVMVIKELNPDADVYIMGYYNAFPYLPEEQQNQLNPLMDKLNETIEKVAKRTGSYYVPTFDAMKKNYKEYLPNPRDIHPSLEGYQVLADQFWTQMQREFPLASLDIGDRSISMKQDSEKQLTVIAVYKNGAKLDVTELAKWKSVKKNIAEVDETGLVTAKAKGKAKIEAKYGIKTTSVTVTVK